MEHNKCQPNPIKQQMGHPVVVLSHGQLTHLEENICTVVDEEDECADAGEVDGPGEHHQPDRRHVVDEHLPESHQQN